MNKRSEVLWEKVGTKVVNNIKIFLLNHYLEAIMWEYTSRLDAIVNRYARYLPLHVAQSEKDDLKTVAQLEFLETIKAWDPEKNTAIWPLAKVRIIGAMKDHIRYVTKSDPSRLYDWITDAAAMFEMVSDRADFENEIENGVQLNNALACLSEREKQVVIAHTKHDLTFKQIGDKVGVSESQASRIYKKAIEKVRKAVR